MDRNRNVPFIQLVNNNQKDYNVNVNTFINQVKQAEAIIGSVH